MDTTLQRLRYFIAVADDLNFTRAAARLRVSQPSLSAQVRALERDVGVDLLRRTTRRVELTEAGASLLDDARRLLKGLDEAHSRALRAAGTAAGTLRMAYTASAGYQALPLVLDEIEARAPDLAVTANRAWSTRVLDAIRFGEVDVGMVREFTSARGVRGELIRLEPLSIFASEHHPLAARRAVHLGDLEEQTMVLVPRSLAPGFHNLITGLCRRTGFEPRAIAATTPDNREPLLAHLNRHTDHLFVGPSSMTSITWKGVVEVPIDDPAAVMGLSIVWAERAETPGVTVAVEAARAVSEREGWLDTAARRAAAAAAAGTSSPHDTRRTA